MRAAATGGRCMDSAAAVSRSRGGGGGGGGGGEWSGLEWEWWNRGSGRRGRRASVSVRWHAVPGLTRGAHVGRGPGAGARLLDEAGS